MTEEEKLSKANDWLEDECASKSVRIAELEKMLRILTSNTFHDALCLAFEDGSWEHDAFDQAKTLLQKSDQT